MTDSEITQADRDNAQAVLDFVNNLIGAYETGFVDTPMVDVATLHQCARHHNKQHYLIDSPGFIEVWSKELFDEIDLIRKNKVIDDIKTERQRQIDQEGFNHQHDDEHDAGELSGAAAAYALHAADSLHPQSQGDAFRNGEIPNGWCWDEKWFKPTTPRQSLIKAAALIVAEIEKLDRQA